jgi:AbrB family looped-hinge helix DNA binding protein
MRTTIDGAGRLVIPKRIRDRLQLVDGAEVEVTEHDGRIEIHPAAAKVRIVETEEGVVAQPLEDLPALTDDIVRATLDSVRR